MMQSVVCGVVIVCILLEGVDCECDKFGNSGYGAIFIYENATFRTDVEANHDKVDATGITGITIEPGDDNFGEYFKVSLVGEQWVLEVEPTLSDFYDGQDPAPRPSVGVPLPIVYAGCNPERFEHEVWISGQNNRAPAFNSPAYSATISKLMPPDVPLHFVDSSLDITATDGDFVCEDGDCHVGDDSNNTVSCFVEEDPMGVIQCEAKHKEKNGPYRMFVSLTKTIDDITDTSYAFKLSAKDGGSPQLSSDPVTVTLNFGPDINPPTFSEQFYSAEMIKTKPILPADIIAVSAVDGDPETNADITYSVLDSSPPCPDCFTFSATMLQLTKPLTQEMVLSRLVTVVVQATENYPPNNRQSTVTVQIPIAGDDHNPKMSDFYQTELALAGDTWTIGTIETFTPTDNDTMLESDQYNFRLIGDDSALFQLSQAQGTESNLELINGFDIANLPAIGVISFFIEVSEVSDQAKSSRSMITVKYPPKTENTSGGGYKTAVIAVLSGILGLVILMVLVALLVIKSKFFRSLIPETVVNLLGGIHFNGGNVNVGNIAGTSSGAQTMQ